jgi:hypothetical protein
VPTVGNDWSEDDEQLFMALAEALAAGRRVPSRFIEMGKASFAWHTVDADLARLTYDSLHDREPALPMRAETATLRALIFVASELEIHLQIRAKALMGQVVPAEPGEVSLVQVAKDTITVAIDDDGVFTIRPVPSGLFKLHCHTRSGQNVVTPPQRL